MTLNNPNSFSFNLNKTEIQTLKKLSETIKDDVKINFKNFISFMSIPTIVNKEVCVFKELET